MELPIASRPRPADGYRLPSLLQDIRLLDLLELSGTSQEASRLICISQPTVSRRYRNLARDFALEPDRHRLVGCWFGTSQTVRLLRLGCRAHRLAAGVARLGSDVVLHPLLAPYPWLLPSPPRFRPAACWLELVRQGVLDGALISGLDFSDEAPPHDDELELLPLASVAMGLRSAAPPVGNGAPLPPVLMPNRAVAPGLQRVLAAAGLTLRQAGNSCQSPAQWRQRLTAGALAMPLPDLAPADWWAPLHRLALPVPVQLPLWLVLPAGWRQQSLLVHTVAQLRAAAEDLRAANGSAAD